VELVPFHFAATHGADPVHPMAMGQSRPASEIGRAALDAVIVTGAEPRAERLKDEPYWPEFVAMTDRLAGLGLPVMWSCLATHAAVLHLKGVERQRSPHKVSGVFEFSVSGDHPLSGDLPGHLNAPHSRWNGLPLSDLKDSGAQMISASAKVGADAFTFAEHPGFIFLQGHPEYDADTLVRECRRDLLRFAEGASACPPRPPIGLLRAETEHGLEALGQEARGMEPSELCARFDQLMSNQTLRQYWRRSAVNLYSAWLETQILPRYAQHLVQSGSLP
jgi:homoserine O-succinyltransferase